VTFLLGALFFFCGSGAAQTVPHVTGMFKTPGNQTPQAAGLRSIATIGATAVYGSIDFQPYDSSGNKPARILCGGVTYIPQKVRAWIKGDGTLVDNATGAAGVDLVPTQGCTPAGLVMRATITLAPSGDGRIASVTWTEDKSLPQQATVDWGSLAAAGITAPTYTGYSTIENDGVAVPSRSILNFIGGGCSDNSLTLATDCPTGGGGGGATLKTNGVNNSSQTVLNFSDSGKINWTSGAGGVEQAGIVAGSIQDADLAGGISPAKITNIAETQNNKNAVNGYAGLNASGFVPLARGGTSADLSATGGASEVLKQTTAGGAITVGQLAFSDISGIAAAAQIPNLDAGKITTGVLALLRGGLGTLPSAGDQLFVSTAASTASWSSVADCSNATTSKLLYATATHSFSCGTDQTGAGGSGITSLNGLTPTTQAFAKVDDANVTLAITSAGSTHTFAMGWTGTLANARGGTGVNSSSSTGVPRVNAGTWTFDAKTVNLADFSATPPAADGKIPIWNQSAQQYQPGDPVVSWNSGTAQTAAWTSATAVDSAVTASLTSPVNMSVVMVTLRATSTMTGGTLNFEADDGSGNFSFPIACDRLDTATVETTFALSATNKAWQCNIAGMSQFRVRLNPAITGTGTANIRVTPSTAPVEAQVTVQQASGANLHVNVDSAPNPIRIDPTGTTTQPVSWSGQSVTVTQGTGTNLHMVCDSGCGGSGGTSSSFGATFPSAGTAIGAKNGANMVNLTADASNNLNVNCVVGCSGSGSTTPADAFANPTTASLSFSLLGGFNGTTWDRLRVDSSKNLLVGLNAIGGASFSQGQRTMANSLSIVPASDYSSPDTVGTSGALNALNAAASVALNAQQGVGVFIASGTLVGTVVPEVSYDGGTTWVSSFFFDPTARTVSSSLVLTNPSPATTLTILSPGGSSNARVRVSSFTSGTATATLRATMAKDNTLATQPVSGTVTVQPGNTANTTPWLTTDSATSATGSAVPSKAAYIGGNSSGNLTGIIACDSSVFLDMATATTTQLVALSSGKSIYICSYDIQSNGTASVKLVYGTGSNCGTGTTQLTSNLDLTAQTGLSRGSGLGMLAKTAASNALCATSSAAVNVHIDVTYTVAP
jgi:hypothetical protein